MNQNQKGIQSERIRSSNYLDPFGLNRNQSVSIRAWVDPNRARIDSCSIQEINSNKYKFGFPNYLNWFGLKSRIGPESICINSCLDWSKLSSNWFRLIPVQSGTSNQNKYKFGLIWTECLIRMNPRCIIWIHSDWSLRLNRNQFESIRAWVDPNWARIHSDWFRFDPRIQSE